MHHDLDTFLTRLVRFVFVASFLLGATASHATELALPKPGQTATTLPNGRVLIVGGAADQGSSAQATLIDPRTGNAEMVAGGMKQARTMHTATVLPDGRVLVVGGSNAAGMVRDAEVFDPATQRFESLGDIGLLPRASHSATVLTDGRVLVVGGVGARGDLVAAAEVWDPRSGNVASVGRGAMLERRGAQGQLLASGDVLYSGGTDANGRALGNALFYDVTEGSFATVPLEKVAALLAAGQGHAPVVAGSLPAARDTTAAPDALIALRFDRPINPASLVAGSITVMGPTGVVAGKLVLAEDGQLAFFSPSKPLFPGTQYTVFVADLKDRIGQGVEFHSFSFTTATLPPAADSASESGLSGEPSVGAQGGVLAAEVANRAAAQVDDDDDAFTPRIEHRGGRWRIGRELPEEAHHRLDHDHSIRDRIAAMRQRASAKGEAVSGSTPPGIGQSGVAGVVLRLNDKPLANVTISVAGRSTRTGGDGRFELYGVPAGKHEIIVDGSTVGIPGRQFATFVFSVEVKDGRLTELPHAMYLPRIRAKDWVSIPSPTKSEVVATHPDLPGLEIRIPKGTVLRDRQGNILTKFAIVPVPLDRSPFPTPANFPVYFMIHPGGAVIQGLDPRNSPGVRIIYPNYTNDAPGTEHHFWLYDSRARGWVVYGKAHVSADGKQIVPDPGVGLHEHMAAGHSIGTGAPAPNPAPPPGGCGGKAGDPVDCSTGLFLHERTDVTLADVLPISLTRTYRPGDTVVRPFGIGTSHNFSMYLSGDFTTPKLILPDGSQLVFTLVSSVGHLGNVWQHTGSPTRFYGARLEDFSDGTVYGFPGYGFKLTLKDGTRYFFSNYSGNTLIGIVDRYGNRLDFTRSGGQILRITTQNGRYADFTYDASSRITQVKDFAARTWIYSYNAAGYLAKATYPDSTFEEYTYDASGRMLTVKDRRGNIMVTNQYDANGRVVKQTLADGGIFLFAYTVDANGKVTQTDVTDPRGIIERKVFNANGYIASRVFALGKPEQQTVTTERQAGTNLVLSETDALGRKTAYTHDAKGNVTSATRLAGTAQAVTETYTYEPVFQQIATRKDALNRTTRFSYDALGNLVQVTNPLSQKMTLEYTGAGQLSKLTDPLNKATRFAYDGGDLYSVTDPLTRITTRFTDMLGRPLAVTNPLGNRSRSEFDALDRITKSINPLGATVTLAYDGEGNLTSLTDPNGHKTQHTYDGRQRLLTRTDPLLKAEAFAYDGNGNPTQATDRKGQLTATQYDSLNRPTKVTYADGRTVTYAYDAGSRLTQIVDSVGGTITRAYDGLDRLTQETTPQGTVSYTYDAVGRRTGMTVAGQTAISYTYDNADRLTRITQGANIVSFAYDAAGRRTGMTLPNGVLAAYSYDAASQLTGITYSKGPSILGNLTYAYDAGGRRIQMGGSLAQTNLPAGMTAAYDAANRLTQFNSRSLTYDANGNLTGDGLRNYSWDAADRLRQITGGASATFQYDAFGRRQSKTVGGVQTGFVFDGINPVQELTGSTPKANMLTGGVDEFFARSDGGGTQSYLTDALGSTLALSDAAGTLATRYSYEAYGKTTASGAASDNAFQYTGRENDGTGLYYYRARYYDPELSRFISSDPIGLGGGINTYAYVGGNPISLIDPLGLMGGGAGNSRIPQQTNVFGCLVGCVSSPVDGSSGPQASFEPTIGGGIEICDKNPPKPKDSCDQKKPKKKPGQCGIYDPNCDNQIQPPGVPVPTGLGFIFGASVKSDGRICVRIGLFAELPLFPSLDLGALDE